MKNLLASLGVVILSCGRLTSADSSIPQDQTDLVAQLDKLVSALPERYLSPSAKSNAAVVELRNFTTAQPQALLVLLTNPATPTQVPAAQIAFCVTGEGAKEILPQLVHALHRGEWCSGVSAVLPFFGQDGAKALASGLTNSDWRVRATAAANLTWPLAHSDDLDAEFVTKYRLSIDPVATNWVAALGDSDRRVGVAAAMALRYVSSNAPVLTGLNAAITNTHLDPSIRRKAALAFVSVSRQVPGTVVRIDLNDSEYLRLVAPVPAGKQP